MIPRRDPAPPKPVAIPEEVPASAPPVEHHAVDVDFHFAAVTVPITLIDGNGAIREEDDRFVVEQHGEQVTIFKQHLLLMRRTERSYFTDAPIFTPPNA